MPSDIDKSQPERETPEQWLENVAPEKQRGLFKVFLGYAPGVGKTYNMLSEAIRRHQRGEDVVIGIIETHGRSRVAELAARLETVPRKQVEFRGTIFEEMDVGAILARAPQVVLIDELAHTNIENEPRRKRYDDVLAILDAKIDVLSTVNIQHVESVTHLVQSLTGVTVRETLPDWILRRADEVVMVDLTPEALQTRLRRGDVYPVDRAERALTNFFRRGNLIALRELALQHVTRAVDRTLDDYLQRKRIDQNWGVSERVAVCISSNPASQQLIARGARLAQALGAEFYVIHVERGDDGRTEDRNRALAANKRFAENLGAKVVQIEGTIVATTVAKFVREHKITQVI